MERFHIALHGWEMALGIALATALPPAVAPSHAAASIHRPWEDFVPGEVLVKFKDTQSRAQSISRQAGQALEELEPDGLTRVKLPDNQAVQDAIAAYAQDDNVEYAQPNYFYTLQAVPNDSLFGQLWGLQNTGQTVVRGQAPGSPDPTHNPGTAGRDMNLLAAWNVITDCSSVIVGVVDSGMTYTHEDLAANLWSSTDAALPNHGYDFVRNTNDPTDLNGHGTHVSGTIGAVGNNNLGTTGVCWKAKLMALRACDTVGLCTTASEVSALSFAVRNNAKVINMSLGGPNMDPALSDAILSASNSDVVVVVAAGNEGSNNDTTATYPCNFRHPNIICVAALDQSYELASFSNFGATTVHVGAPGVNVVSTWAGAETRITDNLQIGTAPNWTANPATGAWAHGQTMISGRTFDLLIDPPTFPNGTYRANADDRVYKAFSLGPGRVAVLDFATQFALATGDFFNVNFRVGGGDPFVGGTQLLHASGSTSGRIAVPPERDISQCIGANCTVGFQLSGTHPSPSSGGVEVLAFQITTRQLNNVTYNILEGTSMATPHVTGLAAMLRAYNPNYTVADVVNAIKNGGTSATALAGKTTTGRAVNALGSLSYINTPTGVTATVAH